MTLYGPSLQNDGIFFLEEKPPRFAGLGAGGGRRGREVVIIFLFFTCGGRVNFWGRLEIKNQIRFAPLILNFKAPRISFLVLVIPVGG